MNTSLYDLASPDVAAMIESTPVAVLPFGSVEQHGPHLPCGTDSIASEQVARDLADRLGVLHVAFCPFGVTPIHAGHPGTISLGRHTFEALLTDVSKELVRMGVRTMIFVNWHEGNTASLNAVATDLQDQTDARVFVAQACYVAQRLYADPGLRFGPHNLHENLPGSYRSETLVFVTYFNAGLRVFDISDADEPQEIAFWIPETPSGQEAPQINDLYVDDSGVIFTTDRIDGGLYVLTPDDELGAAMETARL
jgi:hypothetical protein